MVSDSTLKSLLGLAGERSSMVPAPRNAPRLSVRRLAVAAQQDVGAGHEEGLAQERPKSRGNSLSRRGSRKQLQRTVDPLLGKRLVTLLLFFSAAASRNPVNNRTVVFPEAALVF